MSALKSFEAFTIIPAIDLLSGCVVRLKQGDYARVTQYTTDPVSVAQAFEAAGATHLHIVDLDGAKSGSTDNAAAIAAIRDTTQLTIDVGGGIRSPEAIEHYAAIGIDHFVLGSCLIDNLDYARDLIQAYPHRIIAGLDHKNNLLCGSGWTQTSSIDVDTMIQSLNALPLHSIILTDIATDGMMAGPNLEHLAQCIRISQHPIILSGGVHNAEAVIQAKQIGAAGCIIGKALLSGALSLNEIYAILSPSC